MDTKTPSALSTDANWVRLQSDIASVHAPLRQAVETVVDEKVSNYPILVAYAGDDTESLPGILVLEVPTSRQLVWTIQVTTLEELVARQVIDRDKVDPFRKVYREKPGDFCFLIIDEAGGRFGFIKDPNTASTAPPDNSDSPIEQ